MKFIIVHPGFPASPAIAFSRKSVWTAESIALKSFHILQQERKTMRRLFSACISPTAGKEQG
jgi:hypothetical protein